MGITIFAVANSIGDLMTNLSITRLGFPAVRFRTLIGLDGYRRVLRFSNAELLTWDWYFVLVCHS
jgi:hypothetical protein